ncbi:hypothetical protein Tco_1072850 [Tanacetum coccineum]
MGTPTQVCVWSCPNFSAPAGRPFRGVTPTVEENRQTRPKKYSELTEAQQLQDDCDVQATNIILHGLLLYVYALVNHYEAAKDIWDIVKMLMKDTDLSYEERECRLYNLFNKFGYV